MKSHLARYERLTNGNKNEKSTDNKAEDAIVVGDLRILTQAYKVYVKGEEVKLANREFELLLFLVANPNIVFSKETLLREFGAMIMSATALPSPCILTKYEKKSRRIAVIHSILLRSGVPDTDLINKVIFLASRRDKCVGFLLCKFIETHFIFFAFFL